MDLTPYAADMLRLADAEHGDEVDTALLLDALSASARASIASFAGARFVLVVDGRPVAFSVLEAGTHPSDIVTSLVIPLDAIADVAPGSMLVLYASRPGALVDLAADAVVALGIGQDAVTLDRHVPVPGESLPPSGLAEAMLANQAIGVLISRGQEPEAARIELHRLAWMADLTVGEAAAALIAGAEHSDLRPPPG